MSEEAKNEKGFSAEEFLHSIGNYIVSLIGKLKGKRGKEIDQEIINSARSDEEREALQEMCNDVDTYYRKRRELRESGLSNGKWLERETEQMVKEVYPEATDDDIREVKRAVAEGMDKNIEAIADELDREMDEPAKAAKELTNDK